jgi:hypothetical protein
LWDYRDEVDVGSLHPECEQHVPKTDHAAAAESTDV